MADLHQAVLRRSALKSSLRELEPQKAALTTTKSNLKAIAAELRNRIGEK